MVSKFGSRKSWLFLGIASRLFKIEKKLADKKKLRFLINPASGQGDKWHIKQLITEVIDAEKIDAEYRVTEYPGHAVELTEQAKDQGYDGVVAVGGDGTVNEVARTLIHTDMCLGIVPCGSGNGLARHLGIPMDVKKALQVLNNLQDIRIDTGLLNDHPFLCTAGIGFDAHIGNVFAGSNKRGFRTYLRKAISEFFGYRAKNYRIEIKGMVMDKYAFIIAFANAGQYGNNAHISPSSDIQDGLLDMCIVKPFPRFGVLDMVFRLFNRSLLSSKYMETRSFTELSVYLKERQPVHIDGDPLEIEGVVRVQVVPSSLKVLVNASRK